MFLGSNFAPPVIHPTTNFVNHTFSTTVVPHIHPVHTTTINHHMFQHNHYCPPTASCAEDVCHQHLDCCPGPMPGPMLGPMPGPMLSPMQAPMPAANVLPGANVMPGYGAAGPGFGAGPFMGRRRRP